MTTEELVVDEVAPDQANGSSEPEASSAAIEPVTLPEPDDTERMPRQGNPRQGVVEILQKRLERVLQPVDDDPVWHGVNVITRRDLLEAMVLPLPPASSQAASVSTPAFIYVDAVCPVCGIASEIALEIGVKLTAEGYSRQLALNPKHKALPHVCGQLRIRDVSPSRPVKGQTALDLGTEGDAGDGELDPDADDGTEATDVGDLEDQLDETDKSAIHAIAGATPVESAKDDLSDLDELPF